MSTRSPELARGIGPTLPRAFFGRSRWRTTPAWVAAIVGMISLPARAQTEAVWSGADGLWTDGTLWNSTPLFPANGQPGPEDTWNVRIGAGSIFLDTVLDVQRLTLEGGTLNLQQSGPLGVTAGFDWSGGTISSFSASPLQVASGGVSTWSGSLTLAKGLLFNSGALTLSEATQVEVTTDFGENAGLKNEATGVVTLSGGGSWNSHWFGEGEIPDGFRNEGTLNKNGTGTFTFGEKEPGSGLAIPFQNFGTVNVNEGTLLHEGKVNSSGLWTIANGATLVVRDLSSGSASSFQGAGDVEFNGNATVSGAYAVTGTTRANGFATFDTAGPTSITKLVTSASGGVSGSAAVMVTESLEWAGSISGASSAQTFALAPGASGVIPSGASPFLSTRTFNNSGDLEWTGAATQAGSVLGFFGNAVFNNLASGTFTAVGNSNGGTAGVASTISGVFNNAGAFVKNGPGSTTRLNWDFANTGLVSVEEGSLEVASITNTSGRFEVAAASALSLTPKITLHDGGLINRRFTGTFDLQSGSTLELGGGNLAPEAVFPTGTGTIALGRTFSSSLLVTRNELPVSLLRFVGHVGFIPPSGTFTAANAELTPSGALSPSGSRVRLTGGLLWSGGFVGGQGPFPAGSGGTLELAAGSSSTLSGTGTVTGGTLQIDGSLAFLPSSQLKVSANGIVVINSPLTVGEGASIFLAPSTSAAQDATLRGGSITTTGTGVLQVGSGRNVIGGESFGTLDGVAFSGTAELTQNLSSLRLMNGASVTGTVRFSAPNVASYTAFEMHQSGTLNNVRLEDTTPQGNADATFVLIGNRTVTLGPAAELNRIKTVAGDFINESTGALVETGAAHLINEGRISTDGTGRSTNIAALASFENRGVLQVTDGAAMFVDRSFTQTTGRITIGTHSTFTMSNPPSRPSTQTLTLEGGVLEGSGRFVGNVVLAGGSLAPGMSPGLFTLQGNVTATSGALSFEIGGAQRGISHDGLDITGTLALGGANLELLFTGGSVLPTDVLTLISATGISEGFLNVGNGQRLSTLDGLGSFLVHYGAGSPFGAGNVVLTDFIGAIPEPATVGLVSGGAILLFCLFRRRNR